MMLSMIARRPLAPVLRFSVVSAIALNASLSNSSLTPSNSSNFWYCLTIALFGSVRIRISASLSSISRETVTGSLPTSSGISPNFTRSCGRIWCKSTSISSSCFSAIFALNPMDFLSIRFSISLSIPPPQINRILVVLIWISSWCGCFLPPCGGTDAIVPSIILSNACWTPSPDTSLVMDGFSDFLVILSISSI